MQAATLSLKTQACSGRVLDQRSLYSYFEAWDVRKGKFVGVGSSGVDTLESKWEPRWGWLGTQRSCTTGEFRWDSHAWFVHDRAIPGVMVPGGVEEAHGLPSVAIADAEIRALYPTSYRDVIRREVVFTWDCCKKPTALSYSQRKSVFGGPWSSYSYPTR